MWNTPVTNPKEDPHLDLITNHSLVRNFLFLLHSIVLIGIFMFTCILNGQVGKGNHVGPSKL